MATTDDGRAVQGGPALPVVIVNQSLPGSTPSGTQDVELTSALPTGSNTIGSVKVTDGTDTLDIISPASGQNSALIAGSYVSINASTTSAAALASMDVGNYAWVSVHILTQGTSSTVTFQASNDNVNWLAVRLIPTGSGNLGLATSATSANIIYQGPLTARYFRLNVTGISAGTTSVVVSYSTQPKGIIGIEADINITRVANSSLTSAGDARALSNLLPVITHGSNGLTVDVLRTATVFKVVTLAAGTAETTIWIPAAGKKFRLMGFLLTPGAATTLTFKDNTGGTTIFAARGNTDQPITTPPFGNGILSATINNVLTVTRGTSATLDGVVWGTEE